MTKEELLNKLKVNTIYSDSSLLYEKEMIFSEKTIPISELVERFIEVDEYFNHEPWTLKQILNNIDMIVPIEDREVVE